jgi:nucleotide-binding universal stress UspA family protein
MTIVCGTDFTGASLEAARAAAAIAARCNERLELVHVLDFPLSMTPGGEGGGRFADLFAPEAERRRTLLDNEADRLAELGCEVDASLLSGAPDDALLARALALEARLIVVAAAGGRHASPWRLAGVADRLSVGSSVPVLAVRSARPFERWSAGRDGGQPLSVLIGVDFGSTSEAAATWVAELASGGPCEVTALHVYEPAREARRLDLAPERVEDALRETLGARLAELAGAARLELRALPARGRVAEELAAAAEEHHADLLVVGTHQRTGLSRHLHGSVSYAVLPNSTVNVVVVPRAAVREALPATHFPPRRVLAASDLSPAGDRAIAHALAIAPDDARVTLLHVVQPLEDAAVGLGYVPAPPPTTAEIEAALRGAERELAARVPAGARQRHLEVHCLAVHSHDVAQAVVQAAARENADLLCLATHAHGALATALLGSVARDVVRSAGRPVLLVPPGGG